jgi:hypothetical protein
MPLPSIKGHCGTSISRIGTLGLPLKLIGNRVFDEDVGKGKLTGSFFNIQTAWKLII